MSRWLRITVFGGFAAVAACASLGDFSSDEPRFEETAGQFQGRFLVASDADMTATAYADNRLEPLPDGEDQLALFEDGQIVDQIAASNSVISWPAIVEVTPDGRYALVAETFGSLPKTVSQVDDVYTSFPVGRRLQVFAIGQGGLKLVDVLDIGEKIQSVEMASSGSFAILSTEEEGREIVVLPLREDGSFGGARSLDVVLPFEADDVERRVRTVHLSPDDSLLAVNVANRRVQFYQLVPGDDGIPAALSPLGDPIEPGVRLAVGRWSPNGRFFLVTDVNSYSSSLAMLTQRGGQVHIISTPAQTQTVEHVGSVRVGRFAEGLEISDDGRWVASIAMGRTYLPNRWFLENWPKRRTYSLTLLEFDQEAGVLTKRDEARVAGVLPEDVIFDETGRNLAVAVFHRRKGANRDRGFIDFFEITDQGELRPQGRTQAVARGAHDLVRIP